MVAACELIAQCLGFIGLVGTSATTGLPMWKVTAFIQENIIVMETRWEGLWMNCYRQANIRMQCKVYDSLLYLPPELQAARGLMCTAVALSGVGLLVSVPGLRSTVCLLDHPRIKSLIISVAGAMQIMAALAVFIPVSWTANVIIQDFYNPLLLDAQRRELGEALYIGWVSGAFLFVSGVFFISCHPKSESPYATNTSTMSRFYPLPTTPSTISSLHKQPLLTSHSLYPQYSVSSTYSPVAVSQAGQPMLLSPSVPVVYNTNVVPNHQQHLSAHDSGRHLLPRHSGKAYAVTQPIQHTPVVHGYGISRNDAHSPDIHRTTGVYI